jgi:hypothetical protein
VCHAKRTFFRRQDLPRVLPVLLVHLLMERGFLHVNSVMLDSFMKMILAKYVQKILFQDPLVKFSVMLAHKEDTLKI